MSGLLISRRSVVAGAVCAAAVPRLVRPAEATPAAMQAALADIVGLAEVKAGRVKLTVPPLSESGASVPIEIVVDSPMSREDHVVSVDILAEKNPLPNVARFRFGPRAGRAQVSTRIRLADSQRVVVVARMSDGTLWRDDAEVLITLAACIEPA